MNYKIICRTDKTNRQGKSPLSIQFSHNGNRRRVATGLVIESKYWDDINQRIIPDCPNYIGGLYQPTAVVSYLDSTSNHNLQDDVVFF